MAFETARLDRKDRCGASCSWNDVLTSRHVAVANPTGTVRGDYAARTTRVFGAVTPVAALAFQSGGAAFALAGAPVARDNRQGQLHLAVLTRSGTTRALRGCQVAAIALTEFRRGQGDLQRATVTSG
jgi:hypothetical protein